jgi:MFS family permease
MILIGFIRFRRCQLRSIIGCMSTITRADAPPTSPTTQHARTAGRPTLAVPHRAGFWITAVAFLVMMAFNTVPTPLYALYAERDGFPTIVVTLVFAAYSVGVMIALYLAGHLSDHGGRRRAVLSAVVLETVSAALFIVWSDTVGLVVARFVAGLGIGLVTSAATAHLADLRRISHPASTIGFAATIAGVANMGGLALGPLVGGMFAEWAARPLVTPFAVFLAALVAIGFAYAFVPETVSPPAARVPYRPQRVSIPSESRSGYWAAGIGAFAAFSITGLFGSVAPTFLAQMLHQPDRLIAGIVSFAVFGAAAVSQLAFARLSPRPQLVVGVTAMAAGLVVLGAADLTVSAVAFVLGGILAGSGVGLVFRGALATAGALSDAGNRSAVTSGIFLLAFAGMTVPPVLVGAALLVLPLTPVFAGFVVLVLALIAWAGPRMIRTTAR